MRTINIFAIVSSFLLGSYVHANTQFSATVDRDRVSIDESINLKLEVRAEGTDHIDRIDFQAPDFDTINEYQSSSIQSFYDNGTIGTRNIVQVNKILRPRKTGTLEISGIKAIVDKQVFTAATLQVVVEDSSVNTGPSTSLRSQSPGAGIRGDTQAPENSSGFFMRAEVNKEKVFKGEQLIVSYYIYHKVRVNNLQVEKYPILDGFLREDLDMPVLSQLTNERTIVGGSIYNRALLVKYAAYPLKEGTLNIDAMGVKLNYFTQNGFGQDDDDVFSSFQSLFRQMAPRVGTSRSPVLKIQVLSLPEEGRPSPFSGGVGDFNVNVQPDKTAAKTGEAVTLKLKVEGRGNLSGIDFPKVDWPAGIEQYESKGVARTQKTGISEKTFDVVILSKKEGKIEIPSIQFTFFDPAKKQYVLKQTQPFVVQFEGKVQTDSEDLSKKSQNFEEKKPSEGKTSQMDSSRLMILISVLGMVLVSAAAYWILKRRKVETIEEDENESSVLKPILRSEKTWTKLMQVSDAVRRSRERGNLIEGYELLSGAVFDLLDREFEIGARSRSLNSMGEVLMGEKKVSTQLWSRINRLLEYSELVRYASENAGILDQDARLKLSEWVEEARLIEQELKKREPWQSRKQ